MAYNMSVRNFIPSNVTVIESGSMISSAICISVSVSSIFAELNRTFYIEENKKVINIIIDNSEGDN